MSEKKAKLTITLKADDTIVALVENPQLWQQVLAAIHSETQPITNDSARPAVTPPFPLGQSDDHVAKFAKSLGISKEELVGALDPNPESPYLTLDIKYWEAFKRQTPSRGQGALSPIGLVGTLLALWCRQVGLQTPTQSQALEILKQINIQDKNPSRGIRSTKWLQPRPGGNIVINPSQYSEAEAIARKFCTKNWSDKK